MRNETLTILIILTLGSLIGLINFRRSSIPYRLLLLLLIITLLEEAIAEFAAYKYRNNIIVYHIFNPIEYTFLALIFYHLITDIIIKNLIQISIYLFIAFCIYNSLYIQHYSSELNSNAILTESVLVVYLSLLFIYKLLQAPLKIYHHPAFWLVIGLLLFFSTNAFYWGYYNKLIQDDSDEVMKFYELLFYGNLILYALYAVCLWLAKGTRQNIYTH